MHLIEHWQVSLCLVFGGEYEQYLSYAASGRAVLVAFPCATPELGMTDKGFPIRFFVYMVATIYTKSYFCLGSGVSSTSLID